MGGPCFACRWLAGAAKRWSAVATVAKTKELKKRYGAEEGEESSLQSVLERAVSRERLFLFIVKVAESWPP